MIKRAALSCVLAFSAALLTPTAATAASAVEPPVPASAVAITSLPFSTSSFRSTDDLATPATAPADLAVAAACAPGQQIAAPIWARLAPSTPTTVLARTQPTYSIGRGTYLLEGGVAIVSATTGEVLDCSVETGLSQTGPTVVGPDGVYIVAFHLVSEPPALDYSMHLPLYVAETTGVRPPNDDRAAATPIQALPFTATVDRYAATKDAVDLVYDASYCGSPGSVGPPPTIHSSIWYRFFLAEPAVLNPSTVTSSPFLRTSGATQIAEVTADGLRPAGCPQTVLKAGTPYLVQVADVGSFPLAPMGQGAPRTVSLTGTARLHTAPAATRATLASSLADRSATVSWQAPDSDGGMPIIGYRVSRNGVDDGGGGPWSTVVSATTRSFTFTQLVPGAPYALSVEAVNAVGTGAAAILMAELGAVAGAPTAVSATSDLDSRSATLTWSPPADDGGLPITGYVVARGGTDTGGTGAWSTTVPATARSQSFTHLLPDTSYRLSVQAITDAGLGRVASAYTTLRRNPGAGYLPLDPQRVLDTRTGLGGTQAKLGPGGTLTLQVTGPVGSGLAPVGSTAVALNVTATNPTATGYVSVFPTGSAAGPASSNLNVVAGQTVPNMVISKVSAQGTVTLFNANGTVDLIADLQGAFRPDPATSSYLPMDPQRLLDTRTGLGSGSAAKIGPGGTLRLQVTGPGKAPAGTTAVALNVTATNPTAVGYVSVFPTGFAAGPGSSNLNVTPGETVPNLVVSKVAADGSVTLFNSSGSVDLIADLQGVFVTGTGGHTYRPADPQRVLDTRSGLGVPNAGKVGPGGTVRLQVTGPAGSGLAPVGSTAVVLNVTATDPTAVGYVSVYPTGSPTGPSSSNLNVVPGRTVPNLVISKVAADGTVTLYNANGTVDLIADLQGSYSSGGAVTAAAGKAADKTV